MERRTFMASLVGAALMPFKKTEGEILTLDKTIQIPDNKLIPIVDSDYSSSFDVDIRLNSCGDIRLKSDSVIAGEKIRIANEFIDGAFIITELSIAFPPFSETRTIIHR